MCVRDVCAVVPGNVKRALHFGSESQAYYTPVYVVCRTSPTTGYFPCWEQAQVTGRRHTLDGNLCCTVDFVFG
jgi:hypothetical protein